MTRKFPKLVAALAVSALPMTSIATTAVVISAEAALAAGKPDKPGKPGNSGKPEKADKSNRGNGGSASVMKGLNSLKRNINGLMNSSDPKMEGFRNYLLASEALIGAQDMFAIAQGEFDTAKTEYDAMGLTGDAQADLTALQAELDGLVAPDPETATEDEINAYNAKVAELTGSIATVQTFITETTELEEAAAAVAEASAGASEEEMLQAFVDAMHASGQTDFTLDDITDDMLALFQKHIDNYLN